MWPAGVEAPLLALAWLEAPEGRSVLAIFAAELSVGWLRVVGYLEVVDPRESLWVNLLWDVIFHVAVAVHEEVSGQ